MENRMIINLIGNGFDLYHGLPSSYYYFGCYLIENDFEFYERLCSAYDIRYRINTGPSIAHEYNYGVENIFWSSFENHLGEVEDNFIIDTAPDDLYLENSDPVEIEIDNDIMANELRNYFTKWVKETLDCECNYDIIRTLIGENILNFNNNDCYIVFNYTHILQNIYNVDDNRIHYVHGECLDEYSELIVGHGNNIRIDAIRKYIEELEADYSYSQSDLNRINENEALFRYLSKLLKDVSLCNLQCAEFYNEFNEDVDEINIYGLSIGEVDLPYLIYLRERYQDANWRFSYYSQQDIERINYVAEVVLELPINGYETFLLNNPISNIIKEEILSTNGIVEYKEI